MYIYNICYSTFENSTRQRSLAGYILWGSKEFGTDKSNTFTFQSLHFYLFKQILKTNWIVCQSYLQLCSLYSRTITNYMQWEGSHFICNSHAFYLILLPPLQQNYFIILLILPYSD